MQTLTLHLDHPHNPTQAAASAGMAPVIIPRRFTANGQWPDAVAKFEGYEGGQASWPRLKSLVQ